MRVAQVYVPGLGFRSTRALAQPSRTVVERDDRALGVTRFVSSDAGTEVHFEVRDPALEAACMGGTFDIHSISNTTAELRDARGHQYERTQFPNGMSYGQHEFGTFGRSIGFAPLPEDQRHVVLAVHGALGEWEVPLDLVPIARTGVLVKRELDASVTSRGVTVRVVGAALGESETVIEFAVEAPGQIVRGVGAEMQRQGPDRLVLVGALGDRYEETMSGETVWRPGSDAARGYALFPAIPTDAGALRLLVPSVVVEDPEATLDFDLPVLTRQNLSFGPYPVQLHPMDVVDDLLAPPGQPPGHGLRGAIAPATSNEDRQFVRALKIVLDGRTQLLGFGWHPEPDTVNFDVPLERGVEPKHATLTNAIVRVRGPWEIAFDRPEHRAP
jgi:hypothetical protein